MDPITTAIVAAIAAGATSGLKDMAHSAIVESYKGLKSLLIKKFGDESALVTAVNALEKKPDSAPWRQVVEAEIKEVKADQDQQIKEIVNKILDEAETKEQSLLILGDGMIVGNEGYVSQLRNTMSRAPSPEMDPIKNIFTPQALDVVLEHLKVLKGDAAAKIAIGRNIIAANKGSVFSSEM